MAGLHEGEVVRASEETYELAESPAWDPVHRQIIWVDILDGAWFEGELHDDSVVMVAAHRQADESIGAALPTRVGGRVIVGRHSVWSVDADDRNPVRGFSPTAAGSRTNDCAVDPAGRLLVGTVSMEGVLGPDRLIRLEFDGSTTVIDDDLSCSNGLAWSSDGCTFYSVDSVGHRIFVRSYDPASGKVGRRTVHVDLGDEIPDGICMDAEDNLWVAVWGSGQVRRFSPEGELVGTVRVPVPLVSSVAFVGTDLDRLLITTARENLSPAQLAEYPDSGSLFIHRPAVVGLPTASWLSPALPDDT